MSNKEIKCVHCGQWTSGNGINCQNCDGLVDYKIIDLEERESLSKAAEQRRKQNESKFERLIQKMQASTHPLARVSFHVLNIIWIIYSALIAFVIWFTAIFSG